MASTLDLHSKSLGSIPSRSTKYLTMEDKIRIFLNLHKVFADFLLDDTWLCDKPITEEETEATWNWALQVEEETVSIEEFESKFGFTFKDLADYWNKNILRLN